MEPGPHVEEMEAAIRADGEGLRALLDGDDERARERLAEAVAPRLTAGGTRSIVPAGARISSPSTSNSAAPEATR